MQRTTKQTMWLSLAFAFAWVAFSLTFALPWVQELGVTLGSLVLAWMVVFGVAILPGFANGFILPALLLDTRPKYDIPKELPGISILIAAYNEEEVVHETFESIAEQNYPGKVHICFVDDGSTDRTCEIAQGWIDSDKYNKDKFEFTLVTLPENRGKAAALNAGLKCCVDTEYVVTIDADTYLYKDALAHLVTNMIMGPENTAAVAGSVLARNSRKNFLTKLQEWDYFMGIAVVKRTQSLMQGTLVAQGAFSIYDTKVLRDLDGWDENAIGEDIVMTWAFREAGYRVGYSERAFAFTNVPEKYSQFFKQRERWSRGLIEAFRKHPKVITQLNYNTPFIWMNLMFPFTDLMFVMAFLPGIIAALFFQWYAIAGIMTLMLIPLAIALCWTMFVKQQKIFKDDGLIVRRHFLGFVAYMFAYQIVMVPATLIGYWREILKLGTKNWGTK